MKECDLRLTQGEFDKFLLNFDLIVPPVIVRYLEKHRTAPKHTIVRFLYDEAMTQMGKRNFTIESLAKEAFDEMKCAPCVSWCLELMMTYDRQKSLFERFSGE